jgi:hypothetical protein
MNETGGVICSASSGGGSIMLGDGRWSLCSASTKFKGIVGTTPDLLAATHGSSDKGLSPVPAVDSVGWVVIPPPPLLLLR